MPPLLHAGFWRRLGALAYDALLLGAVLFGAGALGVALGAAVYGGAAFEQGNPLVGNPLYQSWLLIVAFAFYGWFWVHGGQTLGLRAWKLRVQLPDGRGIGWWHALLRFLAGGAWLLPTIYLHTVAGLALKPSLLAGLGCLVLATLVRFPDRCSGTTIVSTRNEGRGTRNG